MSEHTASVRWTRGDGDFLKSRYSRAHTWTFDGGVTVPASSSPHVVPLPYSNAANVDPEEAYVASIASCHMLWFLSIAAKRGFVVERYEDDARGMMSKDERGREWMSQVTLMPRIAYGGERRPTSEEEAELHHEAHDACFIANSVRTAITVRDAAPAAAS